MARQKGQLYVGVECSECGVHGEGIPADNGKTRCGKCGQFGSEATEYCAHHDLDYTGLYPEDNHCPMCREERRQREQRVHEMTRDPQIEPW